MQSVAGRPRHLRPGDGSDAVPAGHLGALRLRRRRRRQGRRPEPVRRVAGRRPLPVQRRPEPARPVPGDDGDPALQQLDGLRPERAGLGRGVRDRRGARRPAADHRVRSRRSATPTWTPTREGLGPGLPLNALGLPANDPLASMPLLAAPTSPTSCRHARRGPASCRGPRRTAGSHCQALLPDRRRLPPWTPPHRRTELRGVLPRTPRRPRQPAPGARRRPRCSRPPRRRPSAPPPPLRPPPAPPAAGAPHPARARRPCPRRRRCPVRRPGAAGQVRRRRA